MKVVQIGIALGIAILLPLLAQMTVRFWAEPPDYRSYYEYYPPQPKSDKERAAAEQSARARQEALEKAEAAFNLQVFYTSFPLGVLEVLGGFCLRRRITLAAGLFFGGLSTIAFGSFACWDTLPGWARYASLLFVLLLLAAFALQLDRQQAGSEAAAT
jgi:hypothetical protein